MIKAEDLKAGTKLKVKSPNPSWNNYPRLKNDCELLNKVPFHMTFRTNDITNLYHVAPEFEEIKENLELLFWDNNGTRTFALENINTFFELWKDPEVLDDLESIISELP